MSRLEHRQRIARLTPLEDVTAWIQENVQPIAPRDMAVAAAVGATLAQDIAVADPHPVAPLALIDGWAVSAEATADAGAYTPAVLRAPFEVAAGEALRGGDDAVTPLESVTWRNDQGEVHAPVAQGESVLMPGIDGCAGEVLRYAGHRVRAVDVAVIHALGIASVRVRRPRMRVARARQGRDVIADAIANWLACTIASDGGQPLAAAPGTVEELVAGGDVDAVVMIGGTGAGAKDDTVHALARTGVVQAHGIAVSPGETAAFGKANSRPVLVLPGRLDAAVAIWLLIGRAMLTRLRGGTESAPSRKSTLIGKVASTVGLSEVILVRQVADGVEPLASKYLPLATLAQADGWIVIPPASEGLPPGAPVIVRPLP